MLKRNTYYYHIFTLSVKGLKYLTNAALALCQLSYTTKSRVLVKGNLAVEFTQGKISKHWCGGYALETVGQEFIYMNQ